MAKIGKYSSGMGKQPKNAPSPYGMSNKGWDGRQNSMTTFKKMEPRQRPAPGYVGGAKNPELKRPKG